MKAPHDRWAARKRLRRSLAAGVAGIVVGVEQEADLMTAADDMGARLDDADWAARLRRPFAWQGFLDWWVARRWIRPRDVTKE